MKYIIPLQPIPLQRHRHAHNKTYNPQSDIQKKCRLLIKSQQNKPMIVNKPIVLNISFFMKKPKRLSKKKAYISHFTRPDLSNLVKFVEDVCNNVLYSDDCLIAQIYATKIYDDKPRTEFYIREIDEKVVHAKKISPKNKQ